MEVIISLCIGIGLSASAGFRVFLPLFALSLAAHFGNGIIPISEQFIWVGSSKAMIALGIATVVEIIAYLIPWVDNILDLVAIPLAAAAGTVAVAATMANMDPLITWSLAIIAGAGTATSIKSGSTGTRLASNTTTGGVATPVISLAETGTSTVLSGLAIFTPVLAVLFVIAIFYGLFHLIQKISPKN